MSVLGGEDDGYIVGFSGRGGYDGGGWESTIIDRGK